MAEFNLPALLSRARPFLPPPKETTIFGIAGRGYYENPASDLLAFFLLPNGEHGLKDLFLSTLLECLGRNQLPTWETTVRREEQVKAGGRIDLLLIGADWCIVIENKIHSGLQNPLADYEAHARAFGKKEVLFVVLSPEGISPGTQTNWKTVSYRDYCTALKKKMAVVFFECPFSKWHLFAREFINHMENELYEAGMTREQARFVEQNITELFAVQKLIELYPAYLCSVVQAAFTQISYPCEVLPNWAVIIRSPAKWGEASIALRCPVMEKMAIKEFHISIYPRDGVPQPSSCTGEQKRLLTKHHLQYEDKHSAWVSQLGIKEQEQAIQAVIELIKAVERPEAGAANAPTTHPFPSNAADQE